MDAPLKIGALVRQKVEVITGEVKDVQFDAEAGQFKYLVQHGEDAARWFDAGHVELDPDAEQPEAASEAQTITSGDVGDAASLLNT